MAEGISVNDAMVLVLEGCEANLNNIESSIESNTYTDAWDDIISLCEEMETACIANASLYRYGIKFKHDNNRAIFTAYNKETEKPIHMLIYTLLNDAGVVDIRIVTPYRGYEYEIDTNTIITDLGSSDIYSHFVQFLMYKKGMPYYDNPLAT